MIAAFATLAPLLLLRPAADAYDSGSRGPEVLGPASPSAIRYLIVPDPSAREPRPFSAWSLPAFRGETAHQVRIQRQVTVRVDVRSTRRAVALPFAFDPQTQVVERRVGKCVPVSNIAGMTTDVGSNRLILYMRGPRTLSATLERSCRARDFYSGFYLAPNTDGKLCVDRDTLLSRSGANCKLRQLRQLVPADD